MKPYYADESVTLYHGDCLAVLTADALGYDYRLGYAPPAFPDNSVDAVCTDPPYGLEFMGKEWDGADGFRRSLNPADSGRDNVFGRTSRTSPEYRALHTFQEWCQEWATECLRVLRPGGHMLAFGGSRTWHRLTCAVEDAGFEIRDSIAWLYGSGFPKSLDVSKAIDKAAGAERNIVGLKQRPDGRSVLQASPQGGGSTDGWDRPWRNDSTAVAVNGAITEPATEAAQQWQGWGTALKPAFEPIVVGRKPLTGTVAATVLEHGTGALNIDACRTATSDDLNGGAYTAGRNGRAMAPGGAARSVAELGDYQQPAGRWPTNVVLDESQAAELDKQTGVLTSGYMKPETDRKTRQGDAYGQFAARTATETYGDSGGASLFFPTFRYEAKAPSSERPRDGEIAHPTVKPLDLMRWLVRLVTPPGGTVLEPFAGSGTTAEACVIEGFNCIAIEREADYLPLIVRRLSKPIQMGLGFDGGAA